MLEFALIALTILFTYPAIGFGFYQVCDKTYDFKNLHYSSDLTFFCGVASVLWPAGIPALLPFLLWIWKGKVKLPVRKTASQRVEEYSQAPTKVLAQIISAKIIADASNVNQYSGEWVSIDKKVSVRFSVEHGNLYNLFVNRKQISLDEDSRKILKEALKKAFKIQKEKEAADKKASDQLAALEALEALLLQPEK